MIYITRIEIQYFRSIYTEIITNLSDLNIFTGKNDAGKSNVLKALNLFFNNCTEFDTPFSFDKDFNCRRLEEVRKDSIKGKQFITIKVTFLRGNRSEKTLPKRFTVTKKWFRNDVYPSVFTSDIERIYEKSGEKSNDRNKASLTAFLNKIRFVYIPAIKDDGTFRSVFNQLRESIYDERLSGDKSLMLTLGALSERVSDSAIELNSEFYSATGIKSFFTSPTKIADLYRTIEVDTEFDGSSISLNLRGDGIRIRYLPSILYYISENSNNFYIWGFEEPENSLEYNLAVAMAGDFVDKYSKCSNIFVTTHSPAFIGLSDKSNVEVYRCFRGEKGTKVSPISTLVDDPKLAIELGHVLLQKELFDDYTVKLKEVLAEQANIEMAMSKLEKYSRPVLLTEGISDVYILNSAWKALYEEECPLVFESCDVLPQDCKDSAAGCSVLARLLRTVLPSSPRLVIGLFDHDHAGEKNFVLDSNFLVKEPNVKVHRNKKSFALMLPTPVGREQFVACRNLSIEFYFDKEYLVKKVNGKGLGLIRGKFFTKDNKGNIVREEECEEGKYEYYQIDESTKVYFASTVVPTFEKAAFEPFSILFRLLISILSEYEFTDLICPRFMVQEQC